MVTMNSVTLLAAQLNEDITTIDLHCGNAVSSALDILERDIYRSYQNGDMYCRVVHGIGTGTLATATRNALTKNPLVADWHPDENGGATYVFFS